MTRVPLFVLALAGLVVATSAEAQSQKSPWEVTFFPAGSLIATGGTGAATADFDDYTLGGAFSYAFSRVFAIEGELSGGIGRDQEVRFASGAQHRGTTPSTVLYNANLVTHLRGRDRAVVPYVTGGLGGVTLFSRADFGLVDDGHYLAGNVGGGLKVSFGRWGLRGDYRLFAVDGTSDAPAFVGSDTRYAHRVYGGLTIDFGSAASTRASVPGSGGQQGARADR